MFCGFISVSMYFLATKAKGKKKEFKVTRGARVWVSGRVPPRALPVMRWRSCSASAEHLPVEKVAYLTSFNREKNKKRITSADLDLRLGVSCALSPELNWLFTRGRWAGLVPWSSTYSTRYKRGLKWQEVRQQKRLNELTQEIPLQTPPCLPQTLQASLELHRIRAEDKVYLKARAFPENHGRALGKEKIVFLSKVNGK